MQSDLKWFYCSFCLLFCVLLFKYSAMYFVHVERFLPRDAVRKRGLCCGPLSLSVRLSVRLSLCHVRAFYPNGWRYGSHIILVFWPLALIPNSSRNPFIGGAKYKGWGNFAIFDWNRRLSRKRYEIGPWLLWNVNRKLYALYQQNINRKSYDLYQMVTFDRDQRPLTRFSRSGNFWSGISQKLYEPYGQSCYRTLIENHT